MANFFASLYLTFHLGNAQYEQTMTLHIYVVWLTGKQFSVTAGANKLRFTVPISLLFWLLFQSEQLHDRMVRVIKSQWNRMIDFNSSSTGRILPDSIRVIEFMSTKCQLCLTNSKLPIITHYWPPLTWIVLYMVHSPHTYNWCGNGTQFSRYWNMFYGRHTSWVSYSVCIVDSDICLLFSEPRKVVDHRFETKLIHF